MPWIETEKLTPQAGGTALGLTDIGQVYNGLDGCITREVLDALEAAHGSGPNMPCSTTYAFERALQAPYLEIMLRGLKVDETSRRSAVASLRQRLINLGGDKDLNQHGLLQRYAYAVWGKPLNPRSTQQLIEFFYTKMRLPEQTIRQKGVTKVSMNRETLEKLEVYYYAQPIIATILRIRDLTKQLQVFETEIDPDGRWRCSYNIAGTENGRSSSSKSSEGTGNNLQNIDPALRYVFVADPGWKLANIDAAQSEARDVGWLHGTLFGDWTYLDNCESGDLHTSNCRLIWPELPWTGNLKQDLEIAERDFYYGFSYRDMSKRGGHLTNYYGTAWTAARNLKVHIRVMETFREKYLAAFPAFPRWWTWVGQQLQLHTELTTPFGFRRTFFGRPGDDTTLREAIACVPQSMTAQRVNLGLWRIWKYMPEVKVLGNGFDSILFQYREEDEERIISKALSLMEVPLYHAASGRKFLVPNEAKVGWNWMDAHNPSKPLSNDKNKYNPNGLMKWRGSKDPRRRLEGMEKPIL